MNTARITSITRLLHSWEQGEPQAMDRLLQATHDQLLGIGRRLMQGEARNHSLQTTALVNETYLRIRQLNQLQWRDRQHFYAVVAGVMRRILVDQARARYSQKRGGHLRQVTLDDNLAEAKEAVNSIELDIALDKLAATDDKQALIVELRYFGGLSIAETASQMNISAATVKRKWTLAQAWLYRELGSQ